jgi:hypothetical protein
MQDAVPPPVTTADNELFPLQTQTGGCYTTEGGVMAVASAERCALVRKAGRD